MKFILFSNDYVLIVFFFLYIKHIHQHYIFLFITQITQVRRTCFAEYIIFNQFLCLPTKRYDAIFERVCHSLWKQHSCHKKPLDPSLKLATTLRHLVSGAKYSDMHYSWRVAEITLYVVVREVCLTICDNLSQKTKPTQILVITFRFILLQMTKQEVTSARQTYVNVTSTNWRHYIIN